MNAGDVVFFPSDGSWWDFFIRLVSPNFTHVGFAIDTKRIVEANLAGVVVTDLCDCKHPVIKTIRNLNSEQLECGIMFATRHLGEKYSISAAVQAGLLRLFGLMEFADYMDSNWTCSEFVCSVIRVGMGIPVIPRIPAADVLPDDLLNAGIWGD